MVFFSGGLLRLAAYKHIVTWPPNIGGMENVGAIYVQLRVIHCYVVKFCKLNDQSMIIFGTIFVGVYSWFSTQF